MSELLHTIIDLIIKHQDGLKYAAAFALMVLGVVGLALWVRGGEKNDVTIGSKNNAPSHSSNSSDIYYCMIGRRNPQSRTGVEFSIDSNDVGESLTHFINIEIEVGMDKAGQMTFKVFPLKDYIRKTQLLPSERYGGQFYGVRIEGTVFCVLIGQRHDLDTVSFHQNHT
jgi:hypothetical protein